MKGFFLSLVIISACLASAFAEPAYRMFTDRQGRKVRGRVVAFNEGERVVLIERGNGKTYTLTLDYFSDADQAYIKVWKPDAGKPAGASNEERPVVETSDPTIVTEPGSTTTWKEPWNGVTWRSARCPSPSCWTRACWSRR